MTLDQITLRTILADKPLGNVMRAARHITGAQCPACDSFNTEQGAIGAYRCADCDQQWDIND